MTQMLVCLSAIVSSTLFAPGFAADQPLSVEMAGCRHAGGAVAEGKPYDLAYVGYKGSADPRSTSRIVLLLLNEGAVIQRIQSNEVKFSMTSPSGDGDPLYSASIDKQFAVTAKFADGKFGRMQINFADVDGGHHAFTCDPINEKYAGYDQFLKSAGEK